MKFYWKISFIYKSWKKLSTEKKNSKLINFFKNIITGISLTIPFTSNPSTSRHQPVNTRNNRTNKISSQNISLAFFTCLPTSAQEGPISLFFFLKINTFVWVHFELNKSTKQEHFLNFNSTFSLQFGKTPCGIRIKSEKKIEERIPRKTWWHGVL